MIRVSGLSFSYTSVPFVELMSFEIGQGEICGTASGRFTCSLPPCTC